MRTIHEKILKEKIEIQNKIKSLKSKIKKLPSGYLVISKNNNSYKWYQSYGHTKVYIPKKNKKLAEELAIKKYLNCELENLRKEEKAINAYLNEYDNNSIQNSDEFLQKESRYYELLSEYFKPKSQKLLEWMNMPYDTNEYKSENLKCRTARGRMVRSKSESIIADLLDNYQIPYRYESALNLGGHIIYPDFTIRHPMTGEMYYWEHCGLMDDEDYVKKFCQKLADYVRNGIIPSVNLIITYETKEHTFNVELARKMIEYYFT